MRTINTDPKKINEILTRGVEEIIQKENLFKKLKSGKKLRIKLGIDPTSPHLHLGNAVVLRKLKEFQNLGHTVIFIVGDFTAQIGDPSGKLSIRKTLAEKEIKDNMENYRSQAGKILNLKKTEIVYNSQHLSKISFLEMYRISHFFSANQILERDMFKKRKEMGRPIWLHEFFYPVFQAYDSVAVKADIEIGGSDQLFNMLMGRQLQPHFNQPPQDIITMKILVGTDGVRKMSKSFDNYIGINDSPDEQFGKLMSIKDKEIPEYLELCTDLPLIEIKKNTRLLKEGAVNPRDLKAKLAKEIISLYHGKKDALSAEKEFNRVFKEKKLPLNLAGAKIREKFLNILDLLIKAKLASSKSEAKRLVSQRGVKIGGKTKSDWKEAIEIKKDLVIQVGKRKFVKLN